MTGWELLVSRRNIHLFPETSDLSRPFGRFFGSHSWFRPGQIVEISGLLELGIINLIVECIVIATIPKSFGGLDTCVGIIDTDGNILVERLYSAIKCQVGDEKTPDLMKKIQLARTLDEYQFTDALLDTPDVGMLVISSISFPIRKSSVHRIIKNTVDRLQTLASSGMIVLFTSHVSQVPGSLWNYHPTHGTELTFMCDTRIMIYSDKEKIYARVSEPTLEKEMVIELDGY